MRRVDGDLHGSDDLQGAEFVDTDLSGARFVGADLSGVVMRGVQVEGADIDAPWLLSGDGSLLVNGVDVTPFVEAELNRRFPGRAEQRAEDPEGLRSAWAALERTWAATLERVAAMPEGTVDVSVDGRVVVRADAATPGAGHRHVAGAGGPGARAAVPPARPARRRHRGRRQDETAATAPSPSYDEVLEARAGRVAMVRDFLATVTPEALAEERANPHDPAYPETMLSCLHVVLEEEWEHHRYAVRDLDAIDATAG